MATAATFFGALVLMIQMPQMMFASATADDEALSLLSVIGGSQREATGSGKHGRGGSNICKVALEEHIGIQDIWNYSNAAQPVEWWQNRKHLLDLQDGNIDDRIRIAKEFKVDLMILSITGSSQDMKEVSNSTPGKFQEWNAFFFQKIHEANRDAGNTRNAGEIAHLSGFCALPLWDPEASVHQLSECKYSFKAVGALINGYDTSNTGGDFNYYITKEYDVFWHAVERMNMPIYLHPREAEPSRFYQQFPEMRVSPWGFHLETAEHALRFILSGFLDKFPKVKFILGHDGEMLVWMAWRIDHRLQKQGWTPGSVECRTGPDMTLQPCPENGLYKRKQNVTWYLKNNFHITTSGMFDAPGFQHAVSVMGPDRVMFSIDTAYEDIEEAARWFDSLSDSVDLTEGEWQNIAYRNAANLFNLSACGL